MARLRSWGRRLGGLLAVCLLATLLVGPTLDALVCKDDGQASASAAAGALVIADEHADGAGSDLDQGACPHGHCHHGLAFALASTETQATPSPGQARLSPLQVTQLASRSPQGIERPPRA